MFRFFLAGGLAAIAISGAAQANVEFECDSAGDVGIVAVLFEEEDVVVVRLLLPDGSSNERILRPAVSGSGTRYVGEGVEFRDRGGEATVIDGTVAVNCTVSDITEPGVIAQAGPFQGFSFGGNLRTGPGTEFPRAGSLAEGTPVTLLEDSFVEFNGFTFWLVQTPTGQRAYHWGGILCAPGNQLHGVFNDGC